MDKNIILSPFCGISAKYKGYVINLLIMSHCFPMYVSRTCYLPFVIKSLMGHVHVLLLKSECEEGEGESILLIDLA